VKFLHAAGSEFPNSFINASELEIMQFCGFNRNKFCPVSPIIEAIRQNDIAKIHFIHTNYKVHNCVIINELSHSINNLQAFLYFETHNKIADICTRFPIRAMRFPSAYPYTIKYLHLFYDIDPAKITEKTGIHLLHYAFINNYETNKLLCVNVTLEKHIYIKSHKY
jgi:hypothetical protein